jgi:xylan 1,4-beta-xylosidase
VLPGAFHGGFGLLNVYGTPKPAYRAFQLLHEGGEQRMAVTNTTSVSTTDAELTTAATCVDGGVLVTSNGSFVNIFLYNHQISGDPGSNCTLTIAVSGTTAAAVAKATIARIDQTHSNPKASFVTLGRAYQLIYT